MLHILEREFSGFNRCSRVSWSVSLRIQVYILNSLKMLALNFIRLKYKSLYFGKLQLYEIPLYNGTKCIFIIQEFEKCSSSIKRSNLIRRNIWLSNNVILAIRRLEIVRKSRKFEKNNKLPYEENWRMLASMILRKGLVIHFCIGRFVEFFLFTYYVNYFLYGSLVGNMKWAWPTNLKSTKANCFYNSETCMEAATVFLPRRPFILVVPSYFSNDKHEKWRFFQSLIFFEDAKV